MPSFLHIRKNALTLLIYCAIALVFVLPFRWFVAQPFIVSGASMAPTFAPNQYLIIDEMSYSFTPPKRGDVVVFRYPLDPSFFFVKRIIGVPGDTIDIDHGKVFVSMKNATTSHELIEPYVQFANRNDILAPTFLGKDEY